MNHDLHICKTPTAFKRGLKMMRIIARTMTAPLSYAQYMEEADGISVAFFHRIGEAVAIRRIGEVVTIRAEYLKGKSSRAAAAAAIEAYESNH